MALVVKQVQLISATSSSLPDPLAHLPAYFKSPEVRRTSFDIYNRKLDSYLSNHHVLTKTVINGNLILISVNQREIPSSPIFVASRYAPNRWRRLPAHLSARPRVYANVAHDHSSSLELLDLTRQFHNKNKTKTKILTKDRRDFVTIPFSFATSLRGKEVNRRSNLGVLYTLHTTPLTRRGALSARPRTPRSLLPKKRSSPRLTLTRKRVVGPLQTRAPKKRGSSFIPKTVSFETPVAQSQVDPVVAPQRRVSPVLPVTFEGGKPYTFSDRRVLVAQGKMGLHRQFNVDSESTLLIMRDFITHYSPCNDDFIISFSSITHRFHILVARSTKVSFVDASTGETVEVFNASREYAEFMQSRRRSSFSNGLVNRFRATRGYCYLNHVWFLCLRAGISFRPAFDFFWALGKNPRAPVFATYITNYFGVAASHYHIAGWYTGKNVFHCDNRSHKFYTLDYLRYAVVGNDKSDTVDGELAPLSDAQRLKVLTNVHENIRASRDSMLVKNLEIDLVDFFNSTKDIQRGKEKVLVPFMLSETQQNRLLQGYPQFNIVFTSSSFSDHPMAAASRLLENRTLVDFCGSHFADIGGCPLHHYQSSKTKRVHVCRPVLDGKDAQRRVLRNLQLKSGLKRALDEQSLCDTLTVPSTHSSCSLSLSECSYKSDYLMMVQVYDVDLELLCASMIKRNASACYLTMITPGELIDKREAFHHDVLNCDISIDSGTNVIAYKFGSSCYTHSLSTILRYMTTPTLVIDNHLFSIEMISERCGVNYYVVTRSAVCPAMVCTKVLRYKRCCEGLVRVKLPRFCKKTRKCLPGVDYIYVDTDFVERIYQYVIGNCGVVNSKTFEWTWNYVKSSKSRVVISGKMIHRDVCISVDHMETFVVVMLAAGVRSRLASEYLAKNVSLYAGDASISDIVCFSIREKLADVKRNLYASVSKMLKEMFSDVLLMQFLDLDDALTYFEPYSEVVVKINECGFGHIVSNEIDELITHKCASDITSSVVSKVVAPYIPPGARKSGQDAARKEPTGGGLYAGAPRSFSLRRFFDMVKSVVMICPSYLTASFNTLRSYLQSVSVEGGKFGKKCRMLFEAVLSLGKNLRWTITKTRDVLVGFFSNLLETGFSFSTAFVSLVKKCFVNSVTSGWIFGVLSSYVDGAISGSSRSVSTLLEKLRSYFALIKTYSIFDFNEHIPFEVAVSMIERFVLDFPLVCKGDLSLNEVVFRCLYNVVLELNLNALTSLAIGPCDTIKKDMFVRAFSSVVAGRFFTPFSFSPDSIVRLSTLLPMVIRKLLVSFFADDFSFYVGQVQYAVEDFSAFSYIKLKYNEFLYSSVSNLCERFDSYVKANVDVAVSRSVECLTQHFHGNPVVKIAKKSANSVSNVIRSIRRRTSRFIPLQGDSTDYYSAEEDDDRYYSELPGLKGGNAKFRLSGIFRKIRKYFIALIDNIVSSFSQDFLLSPAFSRLSTIACDFLKSYGVFLHARFEDQCISSSPPAIFSYDGMAYALFLRRDRGVPRAPESVLARGVVSSCAWNLSQVAEYFFNYYRDPVNIFYSLPYLVCGGVYCYFSPLSAVLSTVAYLSKFFVSDRYTIVVAGCAPTSSVAQVVPFANQVESTSIEWASENTDDSDNDSDVFFTDIGDVDTAPGLRGGGRKLSYLSFLSRLMLKVCRCLFFGNFSRVTRFFVCGSLVNALFRSKWSTSKSRAIACLVTVFSPGSLLFPACDLFSRGSSRPNSGLRKLMKKLSFLSVYFEKKFLVPVVRFSPVNGSPPRYGEVKTLVSHRAVIGKGNVADSFSELELLKSLMKTAVKEVRSNEGVRFDDNATLPEEDDGDVNVNCFSEHADDTDCPVELPTVRVDASPEHPYTEKAQLLPLIARSVSTENEMRGHSQNDRVGVNASTGLCKYLQSLNLHVTAPRPYIPASKNESHSTCSNAIREFYFLNEVELFSLYTKLYSYFEQLKSSRFERALCECDLDEDLFVFDTAKNSFIPKKGVRVPKDLSSHQMMFTSDGMTLNNYKVLREKILHSSTSFVASNSFLRACETHSSIKFTNTSVKVILYEAPPGGGKTTTLIDLLFDSSKKLDCLVLTANKNSQVDIKGKVSRRFEKALPGTYPDDLSKRVLTIDSYLMNHYGRKCTVLFVDECFMVHSGQVLAAINASRCSRSVLFGDSRQIHYIQRNEITSSFFGDLDIFVSKDARVYGNTSYRCPWDVCEWLSKVYKNPIKSNNTESVGKTSVSITLVDGFETIPIMSDVKYVTYTQGEKNELQRFISKKLSKSVVNTVHEVQGETFGRVALVRTKYQEDSPFVSQNHIIVALSRHVESLHYYVLSSRSFDDTSVAIKDMMAIAERYKTYPKSYSASDLELTITGEPVENSSCKALSAPAQVLNDFLEEVVVGSTTIDFGDPSADMSNSAFECGVDGVVVREGDNGSKLNDHDPARV
nr:P1a polyprotein [Carrot closterovirus 3]